MYEDIHRCSLCNKSLNGLYSSAGSRRISVLLQKPEENLCRGNDWCPVFLPDSLCTYGWDSDVSILLHGGCACCMTFLAYGLKQKGILAKAILSLYLAAFLAGGLWDMLMRGRKKGFLIFLLFSAVTYFCFMFLAYISQVVDVKKRNLYPVALSYQGKVQSSYGLYDTGNLLTDPISGKPVSVVTPEFLAGLLPGSLAEKVTHLKENPGEIESTELAGLHPHFLICRSVGGERMLLAVTLEDLIIHTPKEVVHIESPVLVLPEEPSALGKECQVLLNAKLL